MLRPGGRLLAVAISRFASLLDGLYKDWLDDPEFRRIVDQDLSDGQHRNPTGRQAGPLHHGLLPYAGWPGQRRSSRLVSPAGRLRGRGPGLAAAPDWADPQRREQILFAARSVETQPSLIGFSDHFIAAATRP